MNEVIPPTTPPEPEPPIEIPAGIRKARAHLRADLPALLASRWTRGKIALYSANGRVKIGRNYHKLLDHAIDSGIPDDEFVIERIDPGAGNNDEEEIECFGV
jgi:hypothetical protein